MGSVSLFLKSDFQPLLINSFNSFNINPGMFIQSLTMAVLHRDDFAGIVLPAIYETTPFYFFNNFVINSALRMKMQGTTKMEKVGDMFTHTFKMNYTNYYVETNHDSKLAYFMEGMIYHMIYQPPSRGQPVDTPYDVPISNFLLQILVWTHITTIGTWITTRS